MHHEYLRPMGNIEHISMDDDDDDDDDDDEQTFNNLWSAQDKHWNEWGYIQIHFKFNWNGLTNTWELLLYEQMMNQHQELPQHFGMLWYTTPMLIIGNGHLL